MQLIGIENENEFYPAGFFSGALEGELNEAISRWAKDAATINPASRLASCLIEYRDMVEKVRAMPDRERAIELRRKATHSLVSALGYEYSRKGLETSLERETLVPSLARVADAEGRDVVWILEAPIPSKGDWAADPLSTNFQKDQFADEETEYAETEESVEEILAKGVFALKSPPRHVVVLGFSQLVLVDRLKWPNRSVLRFDLQEIFSRGEKETLNAMACFLSREARAPETGIPLADRLEEEAQRHANAVTTSLKSTVRDAIEILGQEVLDVTEGKYPSGPRKGVWIDGKDLSLECLRYMYRLLFLFYAEANPKLGVLDLKNEVYATGYSLEALRELESVRLRTLAERNGTYLWDSLQRLLGLMYEGAEGVIKLPAVKVALLDAESTPILAKVRLRNEAVQKIIRLLSLKKGKGGTARISYAQLGIGQLGAVYETLISFTGFVAKTDLIELRPQIGRGSFASSDDDSDASSDESGDEDAEEVEAGDDNGDEDADSRSDKVDLLAPSYFVPKSRAAEFKPVDIVYAGTEPLVHPKGTFVYRLAGRDREKSASYYTPEPLARLLVKHALMERCRDLKADEILELKILEPAMGSAAFLVETTNQLADLYLDRKQKEIGQTIPQESYFLERQKVRAYISDRNCFGVDLNPVAMELGAISLWLNSLHASDFSPWFGDQLHAGNSLIGARRASYPPNLLTSKAQTDLWLNTKPDEVGWRKRLPENHVWQWLLPAKDMANFDKDKSIAPFAGKAQEQIKAWRKGGFFAKLEPHEVKLVQKLSRIAEVLFDKVAEDLAKTRSAANDEITLWPDKVMPGNKRLDFHGKDSLKAHLIGADQAANTLPYKRLKTAMDAWCALWLWPLDKTDLLPSRAAFLNGMAMILEGGFSADGSLAAPSVAEFADPAPDFFDQLEPNAPARDLFKAAAKRQESLFRETNVEALIETFDWLGVAAEVAERERFVHFDLIFADVMKERGGFDLILGNPPWAKPTWNEGVILADIDPLYAGLPASDAKKILFDALGKTKGEKRFLEEFVSTRGAMEVTSSDVMNPFAGGGSNNLYRCFIDLSFRLLAPQGFAALIHQDGHLGDPKSGAFRRHWYARIVKHFGYINTIKSKNFSDAAHYMRFSQNIYRGVDADVLFEQFTTAFLAQQVDDSYLHDGAGSVPDIKGSDGNWDTRGHLDRVMRIDRAALSVIHALSEDESVPVEEARFIQPYSNRTLGVFKQIARFTKLDAAIPKIERTVTTATGERTEEISLWQQSAHWHETGAQKDGTIKRETEFRPADQMIIQGPLIHVANPLYKTPRTVNRTKADYDVIDLAMAPNDYLPRTNYGPALDIAEYRRRMTRCRWDSTKNHSDFYRVAFRRMINLNSERSLIPALIPPGVVHVNTIESVAFADELNALNQLPFSVSIVADFLIKISGRADIQATDVARFPWVALSKSAHHRALRLSCLTSAYADLWNRHAPQIEALPWSSSDLRLRLGGPVEGPSTWDRTAGLRTEFARRMALVEIDALVAQALGLSLDQLIEIYRIYFPVLQQYEVGTWYDRKGRIVWTCSKGLPGVGYLENGKSPSRKNWEKILEDGKTHLECEATVDFMPGGPQKITRAFEGPFDTCDRVHDYKRAWAHFESFRTKETPAA